MDVQAMIRQQIRSVVDPMFLRLLQRLYEHPNDTYLRASAFHPQVITTLVQQSFPELDTFSFPLGETMTVGTCVYLESDQKLYRVQSSNPSHANRFLGIIRAITGTTASICLFGKLALPSVWSSFTSGYPVFLSSTGSVQHTVPSAGFVQQIGIALSPSSIFVLPRPSVVLT